MAGRSYAVRFSVLAAKVLAATLLGLVVIGVAAVLSLDAAPVKALVASRVNALFGTFRGHIVVERIGHLGIWGASGIRAAVWDSGGQRLIFVDGLGARIDSVRLLRSLVSDGPIDVTITRARADFVDVSLDTDDAGSLRVARAFEPKEPRAPAAPSSSNPSRGVRVTIDEAVLRRSWVHGRPSGASVDADVLDGRLSFALLPEEITLSVKRAVIAGRGMPLGADPRGNVTFTATFPTARGAVLGGSFAGTIGGLPTNASARLSGDGIDAWLRVERTPETIPTLAIAEALPAEFGVSAVASGPFRGLSVHARAVASKSRADIEGSISLEPHLRASGTVHAEHVDVRTFAPSAPRSDLGLEGRGSLDLEGGNPKSEFVLKMPPGTVSHVRTPAVNVTGTLRGGSLTARALAEEKGANARVDVRFRPAAPRLVLDVDAETRVDDIETVTGSPVRGSATVFANGTVDLADRRVRGRVTVAARDLSTESATVGRVFVDSSVAGALEDPGIDAAVLAERVGFGDRRFRTVAARIRGTLGREIVEASLEGESRAPSVAARADLSFASGVTVRDASAILERGGVTALLGASLVSLGSGRIRIDRAVVLGLGEPVHASVDVAPRETSLRAEAARIDVRRAARVAGIEPTTPFFGEIGADVDVRATTRRVSGHADVDLRRAALGRQAWGDGRLRAAFDGNRVNLSVEGDWNGGRIDVRTAALEIDGPILEAETWIRARGDVDFTGDLDLGRVRSTWPEVRLPFEELDGRAVVHIHLGRAESNGTPAVSLSVHTHALRLSQKGKELEPADSTAVQAPPPWRVSGVDVDADARLDPAADRTEAHATLHDRHGPILAVAFDSKALPLSLAAHPDEVRPFFVRTPSRLTVTFPRRKFADFPAPFARPDVKGTIEGKIDARGTLVDPAVDVTAALEDFGPKEKGRGSPFAGRFFARYGKGDGAAGATLTAAGHEVGNATLRGHVDFVDVAAFDVRRFDISTHVALDGFPLESLRLFASERVTGRLSGDVTAAFGSDVPATLRAKLDATQVSVGRLHDNRVALAVDADSDTLKAEARVDQLDGFAALHAVVPIAFPFSPRRAAPPASRSAEANLTARNFRLAVLRPAVQETASGLDGRLDGNVKLRVADGGKQTSMDGALAISGGAVEIPALGEEFGAIGARVKFDRDGGIALDDFRAEGTTGRVEGSAELHVSGYTLDRANVNLAIPKSDPLPVVVGGQVLADASGKFRATMVRKNESEPPDVEVEVSKAVVRLSNQSTHSLQSLDPADRVRVGVMRAPGRFELLPGGPLVVSPPAATEGPTVKILAHDVEVRRGTDMRVRLEGEPVVKTGRDQGVYGKITLREGFLYVQGKKFEIEKGTITFRGEADNPEIVVTAGWTAPEGSRVYADFVGPLKTGKLSLRSDPPHTKNEILSLVLFGTTTGNAAPTPGSSPGSASAASAAGIGGGFAAQGLNRAIDDLTGLDVTARVDTSESANPRPELEVRIARNVTVSLAHVLGVPPPGTNPDRNLATVGFRLRQNWTLEATFGDQGSSLLDFVWQYRY